MTPYILRLTGLAACAALLGGCAAADLHDQAATRLGLERRVILAAGYEHVAYVRPGPPGDTLHVYFDGDGTPWLQGRWPAADPTPRVALALNLAARDPHGAYLGRPCYLGARGTRPCVAALWTDARYGETVVHAMTNALRDLIAMRRPEHLVLVGYSGGGSLAMLVAERVPRIDAVITIAANLDIEAWARRHGYRPLAGSLDPARRAPLTVAQVHLVGELDDNVPPALVRTAIAHQPAGRLVEIAGYDHRCCWADAWPQLLHRVLDQAPASR